MKRIQNSIILLLISSFSVFSQENDLQSWHSLSFKKKTVNKIDMTLKAGLRLRENSSLLSKRFFDFKLRRRLNRRVSVASGFRYTTNWDKRFVISKNRRFYLDLNYKNRFIKRLSYSIRNRWQSQTYTDGYRINFRQKLSLSYNIRKTKIKPEIASEYFYSLKDGFNKLRSTLSVSHPITKKLDFDLSYRIQQEFYVNNPETIFIFEGKLLYNL